MNIWAEYIKRERARLGLTQRKIVDMAAEYAAQVGGLPEGAGITQEDVSNFEEGTRPKPPKLMTLIHVLHLDVVRTALAYIDIDPDDEEARQWSPPSPAIADAYDTLHVRQPNREEIYHLVDTLEMLRYWQRAPDAIGRMEVREPGRRARGGEK